MNEEIAKVKLVSSEALTTFDFGPLQLTRDLVRLWLKEGCGANAVDRDMVVESTPARVRGH